MEREQGKFPIFVLKKIVNTNPSLSTNKFWLFSALLATFSIGILLGIKLQSQKTHPSIKYAKIEEVLRFSEAWYVDKVDRNLLIQKTIENTLNENSYRLKQETEKELKELLRTVDKNFEESGRDAVIIADSILLLKPTKIGNGIIYKPY